MREQCFTKQMHSDPKDDCGIKPGHFESKEVGHLTSQSVTDRNQMQDVLKTKLKPEQNNL